MSNNRKTSPIGIDRAIDRIQKHVYAALSDNLLDQKTLNGYARAYKNKRNDKFVLEVYKGKNEYRDVVGEDTSCFFFFVDDEVKISENPTANLNICFIIDLTDFYDTQTERKDEEIKSIVFNQLININSLNLTGVVSGIGFINSILGGWLDKANVLWSDMHPYTVFTFKGVLNYSFKNCNN